MNKKLIILFLVVILVTFLLFKAFLSFNNKSNNIVVLEPVSVEEPDIDNNLDTDIVDVESVNSDLSLDTFDGKDDKEKNIEENNDVDINNNLIISDIISTSSNISLISQTTSSTSAIIVSSSSAVIEEKEEMIKLEVPFAVQAPFGQWSDPRQQNACEEVSAIMAMYWIEDKTLSAQQAKDEILAISDWEEEKYGTYQDTSVSDTVERIFKEYFKYDKVWAINDIEIGDMISELEKGNLVIIPANGQKLGNPYFTPPGPLRHMVIVIGYNYQTKQFITNDSGTKRGQNYLYDQDILFNAIRDYPSGDAKPIIGEEKNIIVVGK